LFSQGTVLVVVGSDTGIWDGLNVNRYHCTISPMLYTDPTRNAARVMDSTFRSAMRDSYGTPMKLTWWMMAGNMFRHSMNTDVPTPSTMPVYLMNRYEGEGLTRWGDELTFHYHDWYWSDENGDGIWYWNQAPSFTMVAHEFDQTLAEMLIEEDLFPVSFRSGWHAMDNAWQNRLNEVLPFSMHNDYPAIRSDFEEPIDNVYDWSRAPSAYAPYHPSTTDYQVPGDGPGWNLRSRYMSVADSAFMAAIFAKAAAGSDQMICLWAHLPESDFLDNLQKVNRSAHAAAAKYPQVMFRYCTAVEAMQRWLRSSDTTTPVIALSEHIEGDSLSWIVEVDEPIFQPVPILAVKDRYEMHRLLPMQQITPRTWQTTLSIHRDDVAAMAVAVTDTCGNHATLHRRYLPHDVFVDNADPGYQEVGGAWSTVPLRGWGASYRNAPSSTLESPSVRWTANVGSSGLYSAFLRFPATDTPVDSVHLTISNGLVILDTLLPGAFVEGDRWTYLTTTSLDPGIPFAVHATGRSATAKTFTADVLKLTPLVKLQWLTAPDLLNAGDLIIGLSHSRSVLFRNLGVAPVTVHSVQSTSGRISVQGGFPRTIPSMGNLDIEVIITPDAMEGFMDTIIATSDDPRNSTIRIPVTGRGREYFIVVDDSDSTGYRETGTWAFSNASVYGMTSRYAAPSAANSAMFSAWLARAGHYDISEIVPKTVNASARARYLLQVGNERRDSVFVDQNAGSGGWVHLMKAEFLEDDSVCVTITDAMSPVISGKVLRTDAIQFQWVADPGTTDIASDTQIPSTTILHQNYPNPFNPATVITYQVPFPRAGHGSQANDVRLQVFDVLGREIAVLVSGEQVAGRYAIRWEAGSHPSGIYIGRLVTGGHTHSIRMLLLR